MELKYTFRDIMNYMKNDKDWDAPEEVKAQVDSLPMTAFRL
jgi:hypothetical protein